MRVNVRSRRTAEHLEDVLACENFIGVISPRVIFLKFFYTFKYDFHYRYTSIIEYLLI